MKTNNHFRWYLAEFLLEWKMFQTKDVEKIKARILCSVTAFRTLRSLLDNVEKFSTVGEDRWQCGARAYHAGYLRVQTHTQNM